jgi:lipopolysaccharide transport system ATP-binding protein
VIDEVLAVGEAEFQKKAIGKMQDISREGGRTVLFVSHNMAAVKSLCTRGIVLENGKVKFDGGIDDALSKYLEISSDVEDISAIIYEEDDSKIAQVLEVELRDENKKNVIEYFTDQDIYIRITLRNNFYQENLRLNFSILDKYENLIFINRKMLDFTGLNTMVVKVPRNTLIANSYIIGFSLDIPKLKLLDFPQRKLNLNIINLAQEEFKEGDVDNGIFKIPVVWEA